MTGHPAPTQPSEPANGRESVWDYPRPPRLEATDGHLQVVVNGETIADTRRAFRVLERGHPPTYYIPPEDVRVELLDRTARSTVCEWKGTAASYAVTVDDRTAPDAAWCYPDPTPAFAAIARYVAFYPGRVDACVVDGVPATAEADPYYGGWITPDVAVDASACGSGTADR